MNFIPNSQEELKSMNIKDKKGYKIEFLNRDYFNGEEKIEKTLAQAIIDENENITFLIKDDYGMDKFIKDVRVIK